MNTVPESLIHVSDDLHFNLSNDRISYLFRVSPEGILEHIHFGEHIAPASVLSAGPRREFRGAAVEFQGIRNYSLDDTPQEYPWFGTSDTRQPAVHIINSEGNSTNVFIYEGYQILEHKPDLDGLPSASDEKSQTLLISMVDQISQLEIILSYTIYRDHDVLARSAKIRNAGRDAVTLQSALSSCLDMPQGDYELVHLGGTWSREFQQERIKVPHGRFVIESARGASSNAHNPFLALMDRGTTEQHGNVYATALMYSGNFAISVEKNEFESLRVLAGINSFNFQWKLGPGESFSNPECLQVYSSKGLDGMSQIWHRFIKQQVSPSAFQNTARPTYLNSWEAAYFDVDHTKVLALADKAEQLGVEMLVLDDGWFKGRHDDTSSLGDWFSDSDKFPEGVEQTARQVKQKGLKFGLWFEPEMVSKDSDLFREHPDWLIQVPTRTLSTGRYQYALDLSQQVVVDYLYQRLDSFLGGGAIDYVKWDMNRIMTEVGSPALSNEFQLEVAHRYMLGLYQLLSRITSQYPQVLFENCASGGNRFDLAMLRFMSQGWVSDMCDPIGRLTIINGATLLFPLSTLASYLGPVPNHQNGRVTSIDLRRDVAFFAAARGLSLNEKDLNEAKAQLTESITLFKSTAQDMVEGSFHRIKNTGNEVCWQLISADKKRIYVGYYHVLSAPNLPYRRAKLVGLDAKREYRLQANGKAYGGDSLMRLGIDLPYVDAMQHQDSVNYDNHLAKGDFSSRLMIYEKV